MIKEEETKEKPEAKKIDKPTEDDDSEDEDEDADKEVSMFYSIKLLVLAIP